MLLLLPAKSLNLGQLVRLCKMQTFSWECTFFQERNREILERGLDEYKFQTFPYISFYTHMALVVKYASSLRVTCLILSFCRHLTRKTECNIQSLATRSWTVTLIILLMTALMMAATELAWPWACSGSTHSFQDSGRPARFRTSDVFNIKLRALAPSDEHSGAMHMWQAFSSETCDFWKLKSTRN